MFRVLGRWFHRGLVAVLCASGIAAGLSAMPATAAQNLTETLTEAAGVPQVPAFLPDRYSEAKQTPLPIDGLWLINTIRKKIRIEAGRAFAVDSWLHLFVLKVQPDMIVMRNVQRTGAGQYRADDLPLMGPATMQLDADGNLAVSVQGALGPARYQLRRLEPQYPEALQAELAAAGHQAAPPITAPPVAGPVTPPSAPAEPLPGMPPVAPPTDPVAPAPSPVVQPVPQPAPYPAPAPTPAPPSDCKPIGIDPDSGATICA